MQPAPPRSTSLIGFRKSCCFLRYQIGFSLPFPRLSIALGSDNRGNRWSNPNAELLPPCNDIVARQTARRQGKKPPLCHQSPAVKCLAIKLRQKTSYVALASVHALAEADRPSSPSRVASRPSDPRHRRSPAQSAGILPLGVQTTGPELDTGGCRHAQEHRVPGCERQRHMLVRSTQRLARQRVKQRHCPREPQHLLACFPADDQQ